MGGGQDNRYNSHAAWEYLRRQNYLHVMLDTGREFVGSAPWTSGISAVQLRGFPVRLGMLKSHGFSIDFFEQLRPPIL